jgi:hypothetical protein
MNVSARIQKLRRMAEHPTANPHEAAIARAEALKLEDAHPHAVRRESDDIWMMFGARPEFIEMARKAEAAKKARARFGVLVCGESGYYAWARTLNVGDTVRFVRMFESEMWRTGPRLTVVRMTKTRYVMNDGSRFRRAGQFPGYEVAEARKPRAAYIVADKGQS